jgi:hypothetical protein
MKSIASLCASFMMLSISTLTDWMNQADPCGNLYSLSARTTVRVSSSHRQLLAGPSIP